MTPTDAGVIDDTMYGRARRCRGDLGGSPRMQQPSRRVRAPRRAPCPRKRSLFVCGDRVWGLRAFIVTPDSSVYRRHTVCSVRRARQASFVEKERPSSDFAEPRESEGDFGASPADGFSLPFVFEGRVRLPQSSKNVL